MGNSLNSTVPAGWYPPDRVAVSVRVVPTVPPGPELVAMAGAALAATPARAGVAVAAGLLLVAVRVAVAAWPGVAGAV